MVNHASDLLDLALADPVTPLSTKAFTVFTVQNTDKLLKRIAEEMQNHAVRIFESRNSILLNRFGLITQAICVQFPEQIEENCPYILDLIEFCYNRSIYDMFDCFISGKPALKEHLLKIGFTSQVLKTIEEAGDEDEAMITGVFKIIPLIRKQTELADEITTADAMAILTREFRDPSTSLLARQWDAVSICISKENAHVLIDQFQRLLSLLQSRETIFLRHQESIIKIFSNLLDVVPSFEDILLQIDISSIFADIIKQYPVHAIAHNAVGSFFSNHITHERLAASLLEALTPLILEGMTESAPTILRAFAWSVLKKLNETGALVDYTDKNFGSNEALMDVFTQIDTVVSTEYGGELDRGSEDGSGVSRDQALAMIMKMLLVKNFMV